MKKFALLVTAAALSAGLMHTATAAPLPAADYGAHAVKVAHHRHHHRHHHHHRHEIHRR